MSLSLVTRVWGRCTKDKDEIWHLVAEWRGSVNQIELNTGTLIVNSRQESGQPVGLKAAYDRIKIERVKEAKLGGG